jgi:DNA-binding NarL/FixJ family response regulator
MAKRNDRIDTEVISLAVTGLSQHAIAEKLSISQATVATMKKEGSLYAEKG